MSALPTASIWCCRPCRCGTVVHTEDGRDPANACVHGDAICGPCSPGDCDECLEDLEQPVPLGDLVKQLERAIVHARALLATDVPAEDPEAFWNVEDTTHRAPLYVERRTDGAS